MEEFFQAQDIIDPKTVLVHLEAHNKKEALQKMAEALRKTGYLKDTEKYLKDVYLRESKGATGIGGYIAIPHGKSSAVQKIGVAVATLDEEIEWETLDEHGVRGIVLFAVGDDDEAAQDHLKLLALFARKLGRESVVTALLNADTAQDVQAAFSDN
ncbi:PTS sugar transporter subunit IIA [Pectinatus haikarae]|uniref:PTS system fructose-specific IIA component n=1 Tax=Pectinatus haikarae TaxID=349096 RepID=A0ABT9Y795_9FIRM|nr:fructose PTS transporter subunit IIA [Pectinatus haikarae]MDQ0203706.1 PTS system fructose-specific IIA component [Pectinatus haikarae]